MRMEGDCVQCAQRVSFQHDWEEREGGLAAESMGLLPAPRIRVGRAWRRVFETLRRAWASVSLIGMFHVSIFQHFEVGR